MKHSVLAGILLLSAASIIQGAQAGPSFAAILAEMTQQITTGKDQMKNYSKDTKTLTLIKVELRKILELHKQVASLGTQSGFEALQKAQALLMTARSINNEVQRIFEKAKKEQEALQDAFTFMEQSAATAPQQPAPKIPTPVAPPALPVVGMPTGAAKPTPIQPPGARTTETEQKIRLAAAAGTVTAATSAQQPAIKLAMEQHSTHKSQSVTINEESQISYLNQTVSVPMADGQYSAQASGKDFLVEPGVHVAQLAVADQTTACSQCDGIIGGGKNSCGYHAIKNGILTALALYNRSFQDNDMVAAAGAWGKNLTDFKFIARRFFLDQAGLAHGTWRKAILNQFPDDVTLKQNSGDLLNGGQLGWLLSQELQRGGLLNTIKDKVGFSVIEKTEGFDPFASLESVERFKKTWASKQDCSHIFIINTGQGRSAAHWIAVVAYQKDKIKYYIILDSMNRIRFVDPWIQGLVTYLEGKDIIKDSKAINAEQQRVEGELKTIIAALKPQQNQDQAVKLNAIFENLGGKAVRYTVQLLDIQNRTMPSIPKSQTPAAGAAASAMPQQPLVPLTPTLQQLQEKIGKLRARTEAAFSKLRTAGSEAPTDGIIKELATSEAALEAQQPKLTEINTALSRLEKQVIDLEMISGAL